LSFCGNPTTTPMAKLGTLPKEVFMQALTFLHTETSIYPDI